MFDVPPAPPVVPPPPPPLSMMSAEPVDPAAILTVAPGVVRRPPAPPSETGPEALCPLPPPPPPPPAIMILDLFNARAEYPPPAPRSAGLTCTPPPLDIEYVNTSPDETENLPATIPWLPPELAESPEPSDPSAPQTYAVQLFAPKGIDIILPF